MTLATKVKKTLSNLGYLAKEEILVQIENYHLKNLVRKAHAENRVERTLARAKLKKWFPEVFDVLDS